MCATPPTDFCRSFWNLTDRFAMVWRCACSLDIIIRLIFVTFFCIFNLVIFSGANTIKRNILWVPCERNSSYSFMPILLKLYGCFSHGLKMCMWFGYHPQINFLPHLSHFKLGHFWGANSIEYMYIGYPCVLNFSNSFMPIFLKLYRCFCHGREIYYEARDINSLNLFVTAW